MRILTSNKPLSTCRYFCLTQFPAVQLYTRIYPLFFKQIQHYPSFVSHCLCEPLPFLRQTHNVADCLLTSCDYPIPFYFLALFKQSALLTFYILQSGSFILYTSSALDRIFVLFCFALFFSFPLFLESCCSCKPRLPLCHFCENLISYHLASFPAQEESLGMHNSYFLFSLHALHPAHLHVCCFCWVL